MQIVSCIDSALRYRLTAIMRGERVSQGYGVNPGHEQQPRLKQNKAERFSW